mgnify:CR=1 FL=1
MPRRHRGCLLAITSGASGRLLDRLADVVVKAGFSVFLLDEVEPAGGGGLEKMRVDTWAGPEPAFVGRPEPKIGICTGMSIEPTEIGMINPTLRVSEKGSQPGRGAPATGDVRK